ncbi:hypothetical protein HETIRDRAFT_431176 [Heterobasidion irregulare TC 32-1]|uniref:Uncharacterized protein n=1 Tax=Heterobasidion irregulare (strain TC 32-1) TaxID=747525 RepID=W4JNH1_HETIT|nr:uncharacterized protein HETIRDRAFT_431176 [Heterobasidion irregulare TC 32-1]ETW75029.1 hypothetical protein HETIRDRAFT_431176 [Heterobasidion irregulare TC 32-1]
MFLLSSHNLVLIVAVVIVVVFNPTPLAMHSTTFIIPPLYLPLRRRLLSDIYPSDTYCAQNHSSVPRTTSHPTPYKSLEEILAARVPKSEGIALAHSDCLILMPFPNSNGGLWISSPNMEFVPELPTYEDSVPFSFFSDGMLGAFEHLKWPQVFDGREPHAIAIPGNPDLMLNIKIQEFPLLDAKEILPDFEDKDIPWLAVDSKDFDVALHLLQKDVGFLTSSMHARLHTAASEVIAWAITEADNLSYVAAPSWLEANIHDNTLEGFGDMLRRYSLTGQPTVQCAIAVLRADREGGDRSETQEEGQSQQTSMDDPGKRRRGARMANPVAPAPAVPPTIEPPKQAQRVQNWLQIRTWCMYQAYSCVDQAPVLMMASQWKIALEGNYFAVYYPKGAEILPESSVANIRRLPEAPTPQSTLGKRARSDTRADSNVKLNNVERHRLRRLMEQVDINIWFEVHGMFSPYRPDAQPLPTWQNRTVNFDRARKDENLWAELTWEISYVIMCIWNNEYKIWDQPGHDAQDWLIFPNWHRLGRIKTLLFLSGMCKKSEILFLELLSMSARLCRSKNMLKGSK